MKYVIFVFLLLFTVLLFANNPGGHMVQLTWQASPNCPTCTYNIYRGTATGVCGLGKTPYSISTTLSFEDDFVTAGTTYVYAVTAMAQTGGESTCTSEVQSTVQSTQATAPSVLQGQAH